MPHCDINLTHGIIWPRRTRLLVYRLLMLYLLIMILLLILLSAHSIQKVFTGILNFSQSREIAREFAQAHPDKPNIYKYADQLNAQLKKDTSRINSIDQALPESFRTPLPALVLLVNQSHKLSLYKLSFSQQTEAEPGNLRFDVITPLDQEAISIREFQNLWLNDPYLSEHFPQMKQLQVRRSEIVGKPVLITQYEALKKD